MRNYFLSTASTFILLCAAFQAKASDELLDMSLEQLTNLQVTSVSKKSEKASQAAAAIYVITQEDIRRTGLQSIPELLRTVPGLQVARSGSSNWAVTSRGFNSEYANKLLVLIDGRTIYNTTFSGVYWDVQNIPLEDIDRIEVIRGPGATLWGANAVNGVINIISKSSKDTQQKLISTAFGNDLVNTTTVRYGGKLDDTATYRVYGKYDLYDDARSVTSRQDHNDDWYQGQGGFRTDWDKSDADKITLQGDIYKNSQNLERNFPTTSAPFTTTTPFLTRLRADQDDFVGGNVLGRWSHKVADDSQFTLQAYFDYTSRKSKAFEAEENKFTYDLDLQHNWTINDWNEITWGAGFRNIDTNFDNSPYLGFVPEDRNDNLLSAFVQDKISLIPEKLSLTVGSKFEQNDYTGFEYQPSARIAWLPTDNQTLWASVSRAVRTPNRGAEDINLVTAIQRNAGGLPPALIRFSPNKDTDSERLIAYEVGYRIQPRANVSIDTTAFYNVYDDLHALRRGTPALSIDPFFGPVISVPAVIRNDNNGQTYGAEFAVSWEPLDIWKLSASYTLFESDINVVDASLVTTEGNAPEQQFNIRSYLQLPRDVQFDSALYYVDRLNAINVDNYLRLDLRLAWQPISGLELSVVGQNLLDNYHPEFSPFIYQTSSEIGRSVYGKVSWQF
jgi:iron complex outermembrane receptor protein